MVDALAIGYAIKNRRTQLGLTQAQLADAAGVSKRCLWSLELGQNPGVQFDKLTAVLEALGLGLALVASDAPNVRAQEGKEKAAATQNRITKNETKRSDENIGFDALAVLTGREA